MSNQEQLQMLASGVDAWNRWRAENPEVQIDLIDANLERAVLCGVNFRGALLCNASLAWVNLSDADLRDADLTGANMPMATIVHADLSNATLDGAKLWQSHFDRSNLFHASFEKADLSLGFLIKTQLIETNFTEANLTSVKFDGVEFGKTILRRAILDDVNLDGATLNHVDLIGAHMRGVHLRGAKLQGEFLIAAYLDGADLTDAHFEDATLAEASLVKATLVGTKLMGANLNGADLTLANLTGADLTGANIKRTTLVQVTLEQAKLTGCQVYGCSIWDLLGTPAEQKDLVITQEDEAEIKVDDLEVAQFIYLMLNNQKIRNVIDTVTSKAVLILGRFTEERKKVLDAIRDELRQRNYLPIIFDFEKPANRNLSETITLLARMSRFIIADLTDPRSVIQELTFIIPNLRSVPVVPIISDSQTEWGMYEDWSSEKDRVLDIYRYGTVEELLENLIEKIIVPAENAVERLRPKPPGL